MYDLSKKFNTFYRQHVVLSKEEKSRLFDLKNKNLRRLNEGLALYNEENKKSYEIVDTVVQGSVAMSTVVQNESNDYDIDVAIIFDKEKIPEGNIEVKNIVVNALKKKSHLFKKEPEAKTNCVRIEYAQGYHVDFAIYRRYKNDDGDYVYEHCGSQWRPRDPRAITKWFLEESKAKNYKLRIAVRLLKMFSKSRISWKMPGGLIQSVLANECFKSYTRTDELFYQTIKAIRDRLFENKEVLNPTDETQNLRLVQKDDVKMENLYNRLCKYIDKLAVLFERTCNESQAIEAWNEFFDHSYWQSQLELQKVAKSYNVLSDSAIQRVREEIEDGFLYDETEEFIEYMFPLNIKYNLVIDCEVRQDGFRVGTLREFMQRQTPLMPKKELTFSIQDLNIPKPYQIYWKVKNSGYVAKRKNCVRGQIVRTNSLTHKEHTQFKGNHSVECYVVKDGECVANGFIQVPIATGF
ncbi:nucleotidyltransferase (plasmid) [Aneurinibacillus sp. Ricciae_BoGa-3]|uniref:nucleotidyltransferase n=1 Tax=Aneurinibacillus sp. Ricciae_BoGa-3 TaxID=3022697 RepID=UPI0023424BCB|nr:nucleotidyltransferase [Aneurinibacillus sp. Ricciae_BoGa-3]WCK57139.1 nucleotidyltransferase [Aneurinibacillus sp. Ricciae_BoGa-3]